MEMGIIGVCLVFCVLMTYLILPWVNRSRIGQLEHEVERLRGEMLRLRNGVPAGEAAAIRPHVAPASMPAPMPEEIPRGAGAPAWPETSETGPRYASPISSAPPPLEKAQATAKARGFEQELGGRLAVWAGGFALALAGFFLVQYSIRVGLLTPPVRVILGAAFGLALLQGGRMVGESRLADNLRIAQALAGAGIASLYASAYTATEVYDLIPAFDGFVAMAAVTTIAVSMSLRHGAPIAVLGMLGGYLTPALIHSHDPSVPALYTYLLALTGGSLAVLSRKGWWRVAGLALLAAYGWAALWLLGFTGYRSPVLGGGDGLCLDLYLFAVTALTVASTSDTPQSASLRDASSARWCGIVPPFAAVALAAWVVDAEGHALSAWCQFGVVAAASIALAAYRPRGYRFVPLLSSLLGAILLVFAPATDPARVVEIALALGVLHLAAGHVLIWRTQDRAESPMPWAALSGLSALGYYLASWLRLHEWTHGMAFPVWGAAAMALALGAIEATREIAAHFDPDHPDRGRLLAIGSGIATSFISLGLAIELDRDFLPIAVAGEVLALAWIASRIGWPALRWYTAALSALYVGLLLPQFLLLAQIVLFSLTEAPLDFGVHVAFAERPLFQLALPALLFAMASIHLRRAKDDWIVACLEALAALLAGLSAYYLTRHLFHAQVLFIPATFLERGVNTNVLFLAGLVALWLGRSYKRTMVSRTGLVLAGIALFRIVYFDLLVKNPLWTPEFVGDAPIFNWLVLPYGLPIVWLMVLARELVRAGTARIVPALKGTALLLGFVFVSLEVRQMFQGGYLYANASGPGEVYVYSLAWLLLGVGLLFVGTLRRDRMLRLASLPVMLLTVGKVFLYDAAQLDGLWRVFSFLGLGLCLLGLSWFYRRFVFNEPKTE